MYSLVFNGLAGSLDIASFIATATNAAGLTVTTVGAVSRVPEPATSALLLMGVALAVATRRSRRTR